MVLGNKDSFHFKIDPRVAALITVYNGVIHGAPTE